MNAYNAVKKCLSMAILETPLTAKHLRSFTPTAASNQSVQITTYYKVRMKLFKIITATVILAPLTLWLVGFIVIKALPWLAYII